MKWCPRCKTSKPDDAFHKSNSNGDGLQSYCRDCKSSVGKSLKTKETEELYSQGLKRCSKCKEIKPLHEFSIKKNTKWGYNCQCKLCQSKSPKNLSRYKERKELYNRGLKRCTYCGTIRPLYDFYFESTGYYAPVCKYCNRYRHKKKREDASVVERNKERCRVWYRANRNYALEYQKDYVKKNPDARRRILHRYKQKNALRHHVSEFVRRKLKGYKCGEKFLEFVPFSSIDDLVLHIEEQFDDTMTWANYGSFWNIDHIIPQWIYEDSIEGTMLCWMLKNLRPVKKEDNFSKNGKLDYELIQHYQIEHLLPVRLKLIHDSVLKKDY